MCQTFLKVTTSTLASFLNFSLRHVWWGIKPCGSSSQWECLRNPSAHEYRAARCVRVVFVTRLIVVYHRLRIDKKPCSWIGFAPPFLSASIGKRLPDKQRWNSFFYLLTGTLPLYFIISFCIQYLCVNLGHRSPRVMSCGTCVLWSVWLLEFLNSIFSWGSRHPLESSQTWVFVWFSTLFFSVYKMLFMKILKFSCFADFLYWFWKPE